LSCLSQDDYRGRLGPEEFESLFVTGLTYRPGFLVNSWELASLVHVPPAELAEQRGAGITTLETLPPMDTLSAGTPIGYCSYAGRDMPVCIPAEARMTHVHFIGKPGKGKSTVMEHMATHDIRQGHGIAVLDPHGSLVQRLLHLVPREHADRVIFIDPGDPNWVPIWNPLRCSSGLTCDRVADNLVSAFKSFVTGWGDRLEHLLRHAIYAISHLPRGNLLDVADLLRSKSEESRQLRSQGLKLLEDEAPRSFWLHDFDQYRSADLTPGQHKLSKLLTAGTVSLMLSQGDSSFDLREVMDSGKILLVDLSTIVFNVDTKDAQYLKKDLQGLVEVDDLAALEFAQAIARIGTQVVRIKTYPPLEVAADHCRDLIIAQSRARYCKPVKGCPPRGPRPQGTLARAPGVRFRVRHGTEPCGRATGWPPWRWDGCRGWRDVHV